VTPASPPSAAFFDLDKTVIARSSTFAFSRPFYTGGLLTRRAALRSAYAHFLYQAGGADHDQMERMRRQLSRMVTGWEVQQVRDIVAETLEDLIQPLVYREAAALLEEHRAAGRDVVLVSSSGSEVVEPIGAMLGVDVVVATRMVEVEGRYTGEIDFYAYGPAKAHAVERLARERGYRRADCYAYSDSVTDLPMLEAVGHPCAVNPDRALRREAVARGWPVVDFSQPVPLHRRVPGSAAMMGLSRSLSAGFATTGTAAGSTTGTAAGTAAAAGNGLPRTDPAQARTPAAAEDPPATDPPATAPVAALPVQRSPGMGRAAVALGAGAATAGLVWYATRRRCGG
jgi:HAD superfamily hydrolase (TIGR01490 family)